MILGWKKGSGNTDTYWFGKVAGEDRKFIRVVAGVVLPQLDRETGAAVIVGEMLRAFGPMDLTVLEVATGTWPMVENALRQLRADLKFGTAVVDREDTRELIYKIPGLTYGLGECPCGSYEAPKYALTEIGRQKVDAMIGEGRLHIDEVMKDKMEQEMDQAAKALCLAVAWMTDSKAVYKPAKEEKRAPRRYFGAAGL
jgi:hypothetical protein